MGDYFHISEEEKEEAEREAKDVILDALVNAREKGYNPFDDSKPFMLANLINQVKIDALINMICVKRNLNEEDFEHFAYEDGALLDVKYKEEIIAYEGKNINTNLKLSCLGADGREKVRYKAQKFMAMRLTFS